MSLTLSKDMSLEIRMAKEPDHAGRGLDKPPHKTIAEKIGDTVKSIIPKPAPAQPPADTGNGTVQTLPPAD